MASCQRWQITKERFSKDYEILRIPTLFHKNVTSRHRIAIREVLGARPELQQVDLSLQVDYFELDDETQTIALKEIKKIGNDFRALERRWEKNRKNRLPRWHGFDPGEVFISSDDYKVLFRSKSAAATEQIHDDFG